MLLLALLCLLLGSAHLFTVPRDTLDQGSSGDAAEDDDLSIFALLEKANKDLGKQPSDPDVRELDIVVGSGLHNAAPCTAKGCLWPKAKDGKVYVPYRISKQYSKKDKDFIKEALRSFEQPHPPNQRPLTCIRFIPRTTEKDYLEIASIEGCFSSVGKKGGPQNVSLARPKCLNLKTIQHEMMHALGFKHEQCRSDRDKHVTIHLENVKPKMVSNFKKVQTNNLRTPYDYNSIMEYGRKAFTENGLDTIVPFPDPNVEIGMAKKMSVNDVLRINRLYCCTCSPLCFYYS